MEAFIMRLVKLLPLLMLLGASAQAQTPGFGIGRTPTAAEIQSWDISISPQGDELPAGSGTAKIGEQLFLMKGCAGCHGIDGTNGAAPRLLKRDAGPEADPWSLGRILPIRSPYAASVWDYISRGMPLMQEGTLTPDEVYSITAYLFFMNGLVEEDEVLDQNTLPNVAMPNVDNWAPLPDWWEPGMPRLRGYPY